MEKLQNLPKGKFSFATCKSLLIPALEEIRGYIHSPLFTACSKQILFDIFPRLKHHAPSLRLYYQIQLDMLMKFTNNEEVMQNCIANSLLCLQTDTSLKESMEVEGIFSHLKSILLSTANSFHIRRLAGELINCLLANNTPNKIAASRGHLSPLVCREQMAKKLFRIPDYETQHQILQILFRLRPKNNQTNILWDSDLELQQKFHEIKSDCFAKGAREFLNEMNQKNNNLVASFKANEIFSKGKSLGKNLWIDVSPESISFSFGTRDGEKGSFVEILVAQIASVTVQESHTIAIQGKAQIPALKSNAIQVAIEQEKQLKEFYSRVCSKEKASVVIRDLIITPSNSIQKQEPIITAVQPSEDKSQRMHLDEESFLFTSPPPPIEEHKLILIDDEGKLALTEVDSIDAKRKLVFSEEDLIDFELNFDASNLEERGTFKRQENAMEVTPRKVSLFDKSTKHQMESSQSILELPSLESQQSLMTEYFSSSEVDLSSEAPRPILHVKQESFFIQKQQSETIPLSTNSSSIEDQESEVDDCILRIFRIAIKKFTNKIHQSESAFIQKIKNHNLPLKTLPKSRPISDKIYKFIPKSCSFEMPQLSPFQDTDHSIPPSKKPLPKLYQSAIEHYKLALLQLIPQPRR